LNTPYEADELVPRLPVHIAVLTGINRGEFPFVFAGKRFDRLGESGRESFYFFVRVLPGTGLPQVGAQIEVFHAEAIALAHAAFKVFRSRKIVEFWKMTGKFLLVLAAYRNTCAIDMWPLPRRKTQGC